jgi:uncharacterized cupin superfamily protein
MGITHFDEADREVADVGHLRSTWTYLGDSAGCVDIGASRIQVADGGWSTPAHEHGAGEEIFYVLGGRGIAWQDGATAEIGAGDCILYAPGGGAHTLYGVDGLDVIAFGPNLDEEIIQFPRLNLTRVGGRVVETLPGMVGEIPAQWARESELGPPELGDGPGPRPATIVSLSEVEPLTVERPRIVRTRRNLGRAVGSVRTGLQHSDVAPGKQATAQHCHSAEDEIFVILGGGGVLLLGEEEIPVREGTVVGRPAATGVAHTFRAGEHGLQFLAYGTRDKSDICYYPRSNKIAFRSVHVIARLEQLDYWDGED